MTRSLVIAVRFHDGRYHGQGDGFDEVHGWPPSPGRLFQALVAGAARGSTLPSEDQGALRWLEELDPPQIAAPPARCGTSVQHYVPNNDLDAKGGDPSRIAEIRVGKQWRPYFFDAEQPALYVWYFDSHPIDAERVCCIATKLYQFGRGVDMAAATGEIMDSDKARVMLAAHPGAIRRPTGFGTVPVARSGTLDSLIQRRQRTRQRLRLDETTGNTLFIQPPKALFRHIGYDSPPRRLYFDLRENGKFALRCLGYTAALISGLRDAAAHKLRNTLPAQSGEIERLIVGRGAGPRDVTQRVRVTPIPSVGMEHTDPSIRRILVEVPVECPILWRNVEWAFAGLELANAGAGQILPGRLVSAADNTMFKRYMCPARWFRSVTAVALSGTVRRFLHNGSRDGRKTGRDRYREEACATAAVVQALRHAGVRAKPSNIHVQREPLHRRGVRAECFAGGSRFSPLAMWHVELRFPTAVSGPLVIGDGRFLGLGLMEPVAAGYDDVLGFEIGPESRVHRRDASALVHALRRALMSLARDETGGVDRLFSGHEIDGSPDRSPRHAHVYLAADEDEHGWIVKLIVAAPWAVNRMTKPRNERRQKFDDVVRRLEYLRAGKLGEFHLHPTSLDDGDPLIGPARLWKGVTPYLATRNLKKNHDSATMVTENVVIECRRRGLPAPTGIEILNVSCGPRGGRLSAMLNLSFATAVRGPLLLGRDSHAGGGLFHARMG